MAIQTAYTSIPTELPHLWDEVVQHQEIVLINRQGSAAVAMIAASELSSLLETVHLLSSSKNADRLLTALKRAHEQTVPSQTLDALRQEVGLD